MDSANGQRGPAPPKAANACRFGFNCRRPDCYFAHPEGRAIGALVCPGVPGPAAPPAMPGGFVPRGPPQGFHPPMPSGPPSGPPGGGGGGQGNKRVCRFGQGCTRQDCYFSHPEGRGIDKCGRCEPPRPSQPYRPAPTHHQPHYQPIEQKMSALQIKKETWYADARNCACCKGFVFGCTNTTTCAAQEECTCSKPIPEGTAADEPLNTDAEIVDTLALCKEACAALAKEASVAIDIEGVDLCRDGKVCIIQIAASKDGKVYLFDITTLGKAAMDEGGLKALLENEAVEKLMYDCRADSDALFHTYGVKIKNLADVQILYTRSHFSGNDKFLHGLAKALAESGVVSEKDLANVDKVKSEGKKLFAPEKGGSYDVWQARPLNPSLVAYCVVDVHYLFALKEKWGGSMADEALKETGQQRMDKTISADSFMSGPQMAIRDI